jgi:hypothetical protein
MSEAEREKIKVYVKIQKGFADPGKVLHIRRSLCGLKQAPPENTSGFVQSEFVARLFISDKVVYLHRICR